MQKDFDQLKVELDALIRSGHGFLVAERLAHINRRSIPRRLLADFASLARRVQRHELAISWLRPIVRPQVILQEKASARELAVYASVLSRVGANVEALEILESLHENPPPEVHLFIAFAYMHNWDYSAAIPHLQTYVKIDYLTDYDRLLGQLNLAAAYRFTAKKPVAEIELLNEIIEIARRRSWALHLRNALELAGQAAVAREDWIAADGYLSQGNDLCQQVGLDDFFIHKWKVLLALHRDGASAPRLSELNTIRLKAYQLRDWETIRECDYYRALFTHDDRLALRVYFGTPFLSYRRRMEKAVKTWLTIPDFYEWELDESPSHRAFDLRTGVEVGGAAILKTNQSIYRYLWILASDFYRPFPKGYLFASLYPGEYYDPDTSTARIKMMTVNLRRWLKECHIPLQIENENGSYRISSQGPYRLIVTAGMAEQAPEPQNLQELWLKELRQAWPYRSFSTQQAVEKLSISLSQVRSLLTWAEREKRLRRVGRGRATLFTFSK